MIKKPNQTTILNFLWDTFCATSILGIWPRFIEPKLQLISRLNLKIKDLDPSLVGTKIVQISDLHLNPTISDQFLNRLEQKIRALNPDLLILTGDFVCYAMPTDHARLEKFLNTLSAKHGCYAVLGNHDYAKYVTITDSGDYDVSNTTQVSIPLILSRLFKKTKLTKKVTKEARNVPFNPDLISLLKRTPFQLLHNETVCLSIRGSPLNVTGLGEYTLGRTDPKQAFTNYKKGAPGITMLHNPDALHLLEDHPSNIILCGHTHGGQINLPWIWKKFTCMENMQYKKGLHRLNDKWAYINRGVGSSLNFRWFAPPEILLLTLHAHL